jgi:light-regulated signal transduction histidine kinase (bacteriophytochrome)
MNFKKSKLLSMKQDQLVAYQNQLVAANKELESFSYSVSHDLRAPLRHIAGFVELLKTHLPTDSDEKTQHYMSVISNAAGTMGELIDNLLSFSRMGRVDLIYRKVNSNILIDEVILSFEPDTKGRNIEWNIEKLPEVKADKDILKLVYENLISNALKFTRSKTAAKIKIGSMPDAKNAKTIIIYVKDNGVGFDMQYQDKLFRVFQRLHSQKDYEGTGIGLANVQRIIQRHGGAVWAEGIPNEGAAFYFTLPKYEGD